MEQTMGHNIRWDNEDKTVVFQEYTDSATKDDLYQLAQKSALMLKTVAHTVHLIIDERRISFILNEADLTYLAELVPKNEGAVMVIVPPSKVKYKLTFQDLSKQLMLKTYSKTYYMESLEEARYFLRKIFSVRYSSSKPL